MPDTAPPTDAGRVAGRRAGPLSGDEIERVLFDFRTWLEAFPGDSPLPSHADAEPPIDLAELVGAFTALRHDVNLQTKAARAQAEQAADALDLLHNVVDRLEVPTAATNTDSDGLLTHLIEAADALARANQGIERGLSTTSLRPKARGWRSWFATPMIREIEDMRVTLAAAGEGLDLACQRLERAVANHGLEAIESVGATFNPEFMEALEVVTGSGFPPGVVVEVVRRGYRRNGSTFRCALVKVAK